MLILVLCGGVPWVVTRAAPAAQGAALSETMSDKIVTLTFFVSSSSTRTVSPRRSAGCTRLRGAVTGVTSPPFRE